MAAAQAVKLDVDMVGKAIEPILFTLQEIHKASTQVQNPPQASGKNAKFPKEKAWQWLASLDLLDERRRALNLNHSAYFAESLGEMLGQPNAKTRQFSFLSKDDQRILAKLGDVHSRVTSQDLFPLEHFRMYQQGLGLEKGFGEHMQALEDGWALMENLETCLGIGGVCGLHPRKGCSIFPGGVLLSDLTKFRHQLESASFGKFLSESDWFDPIHFTLGEFIAHQVEQVLLAQCASSRSRRVASSQDEDVECVLAQAHDLDQFWSQSSYKPKLVMETIRTMSQTTVPKSPQEGLSRLVDSFSCAARVSNDRPISFFRVFPKVDEFMMTLNTLIHRDWSALICSELLEEVKGEESDGSRQRSGKRKRKQNKPRASSVRSSTDTTTGAKPTELDSTDQRSDTLSVEENKLEDDQDTNTRESKMPKETGNPQLNNGPKAMLMPESMLSDVASGLSNEISIVSEQVKTLAVIVTDFQKGIMEEFNELRKEVNHIKSKLDDAPTLHAVTTSPPFKPVTSPSIKQNSEAHSPQTSVAKPPPMSTQPTGAGNRSPVSGPPASMPTTPTGKNGFPSKHQMRRASVSDATQNRPYPNIVAAGDLMFPQLYHPHHQHPGHLQHHHHQQQQPHTPLHHPPHPIQQSTGQSPQHPHPLPQRHLSYREATTKQQHTPETYFVGPPHEWHGTDTRLSHHPAPAFTRQHTQPIPMPVSMGGEEEDVLSIPQVPPSSQSAALVSFELPHLFESSSLRQIDPVLSQSLGSGINLFAEHCRVQRQGKIASEQAVFEHLRHLVESVWPRARVKGYGSTVTNLSLPQSDMDIVVCLPKVTIMREAIQEEVGPLEGQYADERTSWQQKLAAVLLQTPWVHADSLKIIQHAPMPVITFNTLGAPYFEVSSKLDVSFQSENHYGLATNKLVNRLQRDYPNLRNLVLVLKQFLADRGLGKGFSGGLSSYALVIMCTCFLNAVNLRRERDSHTGDSAVPTEAPSPNSCASSAENAGHQEPDASERELGALLVAFLRFFGLEFDPRLTGISITRGFFPRLHPAYASTQHQHPHHQHYQRRRSFRIEDLQVVSPHGANSLHPQQQPWLQAVVEQHPVVVDVVGPPPHKFDPLLIEDPLQGGNNVGRNVFRVHQIQRACADTYNALLQQGTCAWSLSHIITSWHPQSTG